MVTALKSVTSQEEGMNTLEELLAGGGGRGAVGHTVGAVGRVPCVVAVFPEQLASK